MEKILKGNEKVNVQYDRELCGGYDDLVNDAVTYRKLKTLFNNSFYDNFVIVDENLDMFSIDKLEEIEKGVKLNLVVM